MACCYAAGLLFCIKNATNLSLRFYFIFRRKRFFIKGASERRKRKAQAKGASDRK